MLLMLAMETFLLIQTGLLLAQLPAALNFPTNINGTGINFLEDNAPSTTLNNSHNNNALLNQQIITDNIRNIVIHQQKQQDHHKYDKLGENQQFRQSFSSSGKTIPEHPDDQNPDMTVLPSTSSTSTTTIATLTPNHHHNNYFYDNNLEELRTRCQFLARLFNSSTVTNSTSTKNNRIYPDILRPVYIHNKPVYPSSRRDHFSTARPVTVGTAFYITSKTRPSTTTSKPTTVTTVLPTSTTPDGSQVKYVRLEPVILQKTVLTDGRVLYLWHRSLPTAAPIEPSVSTSPSTTSSTTTTTTERSSYSSFMSFLPFYGSQNQDDSSTESTIVPLSSSTAKSTRQDDPLYVNQMRFVVPLPYNEENFGTVRTPYDLDPYAYYPKELQPQKIRFEVPYSPNFHYIKKLSVPTTDATV